jgi:hypothetical protein
MYIAPGICISVVSSFLEVEGSEAVRIYVREISTKFFHSKQDD